MLSLKNVTLVAVTSIKIDETIKALEKSCQFIDFYDVKLITDKNIAHEKIKIKKCNPINSIDEYSRFMIYELKNHIETDFVLVVQYDGFVINPNYWDDIFFEYDYIGAPWPKNKFFNDENVNIRVGNGGFSFRSKKILELPSKLEIPFNSYKGYYNEDGFLTAAHRKTLIENGVKYAPVEIAGKFSKELECDDVPNQKTFGFHKENLNLYL
jgi:hypothetical protein